MTDEEVGDLWKANGEHTAAADLLHDLQSILITDLIVKLIEERANGERVCSEEDWANAVREACSDFGIPYDEYLKAKGDT